MKTQINIKQMAKISGLLFVGILLGWVIFGGTSTETSIKKHVAKVHTDEQDNIVYTCSMHPQVRKSEPGNCPICGMELIPVESSESGQPENPQALTMTPVAMKLADVATTEVVSKEAVNRIRMPGKVAVNERLVSAIPAYFPGRIEKLYVNFTGAYIQKGDKLASVYSPKLITAQKELLEAYQSRKSNPVLYQAARRKLKNWELSKQQIDAIIQAGEPKSNFVIRANQSGYVLELNIEAGDYIKPGKPLLKLADLSSVWVAFQAYENDIVGLDTGDKVEFTVAALPGRTFEAEVTYIDPIVSEKNRTITVRTEVANEDGLLKPNMLAKGIINATLNGGKPKLQIPRSAVMWTGKRSIVYVKIPDGGQPTFVAREVVLGPRVGNNYVILEGLKAGEEVVVQGNFMIDAAAQLAGKLSMMNRNPDPTKSDTTTYQHTKHLTLLLRQYLQIKNALFEDDFDQAKVYLKDLKGEVLESSEMNNPKHAQMHKKHHAAMLEAMAAASKTDNLEQFRSAFAAISENLIKAVKNQNYEWQTLYIQFCPMAQGGKGARWISEQEKIANPYLGQKMPGCGETKKTILPGK